MKKILLLLSAVAVLSLVSCGGEPQKKEASTKATTECTKDADGCKKDKECRKDSTACKKDKECRKDSTACKKDKECRKDSTACEKKCDNAKTDCSKE
ncbi:MAG: hypothetical protein R3Y49_02905 [Rikenellaceae bacterium]